METNQPTDINTLQTPDVSWSFFSMVKVEQQEILKPSMNKVTDKIHKLVKRSLGVTKKEKRGKGANIFVILWELLKAFLCMK